MTPLAATEAERQAFEKYATDCNLPLTRSDAPSTGYEADDTDAAWDAWLYRASQQSAAQADAEPVAWAVFAPDGNVRIWFGDIEAAKRWKAGYEPTLSSELTPLYRAAPDRAPSTDSAAGDTKRLDWLDSQGFAYGFEDMHEGNRWEIDGPFATVRAAIDAAIAASMPQKG